jgi:Icc-related predicted phosphoesterase
MKILAVADVHGRFTAVCDILGRVGPVDVLVVAGDLTTCGAPREVEAAVRTWIKLAPHVFAVAGNMDSPAIESALDRMGVSLNGCCRRIGPVAFFGCSASPTSIGTPYEIPEWQIATRIQRGAAQAAGAAQCVFVPHTPPRGVLDETHDGEHVGSLAVRDFIARAQPVLVLCGHIHEARGKAQLGRSLVINCGPVAAGHYAVINLTDQGCDAQLV